MDSDSVDVGPILELVRARAAEAEETGRLHDDVVKAIAATGANRLLLPTELGGFSASPRRCLEVVEQISEVDGSTGWCAAIGLGTNYFAGYLPKEVAAQVFADPDAANASMFQPSSVAMPTDGGALSLTGRWPFTSNCLHASWIGVGAMFGDGPDGSVDPIPRLVFVPQREFQIHQTWDVAGLRATGSHDVSVTNLITDRAHSCSFGERPWSDGPLWRLPVFGVLTPCLVAVLLGVARGAINEIGRQTRERRVSTRGTLLDDPTGMSDLADVDSQLRAARAGLLEALDEAWDEAAANTGARPDRVLQGRVMLAAQLCADVSVDATSTAHRLGGGPAAYNGSALLRALRDVQTARQHTLFSRSHRAQFGPTVAGIEVVVPPYIL